jgi:TolB protein
MNRPEPGLNPDGLRAGLHVLADEVAPVDLRDRALHTSRRIARTRLALIAGATVLAVAAASVGLSVRRDDRALPEIATTPTPAVTPARVYLDALDGGRTVIRWTAGGLTRRDIDAYSTARPTVAQVRESLSVSPDGTRLSWSTDVGISLAGFDATAVRVLPGPSLGDPLVDDACLEPEWSSDSARLLTRTRMSGGASMYAGWFAAADGSFTVVDDSLLRNSCDARINGDWAAFTHSPGLGRFVAYVRNLRTGETREIPDPSGNRTDLEIVSISPDGARVTARTIDNNPERYADPPRTLAADLVVDTRTGATVPIAVGGTEVRQLFYLTDGNLLARVRDGARSSLLVFTPAGRLAERVDEPAELRDAVLLRAVTP